jgi:hypothetical protein
METTVDSGERGRNVRPLPSFAPIIVLGGTAGEVQARVDSGSAAQRETFECKLIFIEDLRLRRKRDPFMGNDADGRMR